MTSGVITERLVEAEQTEEMITAAREKYRPVAARGSVMYFVVADMAEVDPMYQFSLKYFKQLFNNTITTSEKNDELEKRLNILLEQTTKDVYRNVARGLFEKDKIIFSFMLCVEIMKLANKIDLTEWNFFLRGAAGVEREHPTKPEEDWLTQQSWGNAFNLNTDFACFKGIHESMTATPCWVQMGDLVVGWRS